MKKILVVSVHPDDETLGAGGSLLKWKSEGKEIFWCIITQMSADLGFSEKRMAERQEEIKKINSSYGFSKKYQLNYTTTKLNVDSIGTLTKDISEVVKDCNPDTVIIPHKFDAHTDHNVSAKALLALTKTFRYSQIERVWAMETLSETNFAFYSANEAFFANTYVNISTHLDKKIELMKVFSSEIHPHPFPRSEESIRALATLRGSESGFKYAEAFYSVKNIIP